MRIFGVIFSLLFCNSLIAQHYPEKLFFELHFGFIKGGEAVYQTNLIDVDNQEEIHSELHIYTIGFAKKLYAVDDSFESFIGKDSLLPHKSLKKLKEKNFFLDEDVTYYQEDKNVYSKNIGWKTVNAGICDVSSLINHLRFSGKLDNLRINQIIATPFWDTNEWYMLKLKYTGTEKINSKMGKIECLRLEPQEIAGRFFNKRNPMNIWVSNDSLRLPIKMELNFSIGSVKCDLVEIAPATSIDVERFVSKD